MSIATVIEVSRRRRFSFEQKRELVLSAFGAGGCVAEVARQAGIDTSLLYRWRRMIAEEASGAGFTPVVLTSLAPPSAPAVVVEFAGVRVTMAGDAPAALAVAVLQALR